MAGSAAHRIYRIALSGTVALTILLSPFLWAAAANQIRLYFFANQLQYLPLPKNASIVARGSRVGNLGGDNSDNCTFEAIVVIETFLQTEAKNEFLAQLNATKFESPIQGLRPPRLEIYSDSNGFHHTVQLTSGPYDANADPRCW